MSVKGIRSSLSEADGSKADSLLTFWTRSSALDKMLLTLSYTGGGGRGEGMDSITFDFSFK